MIINTKTAEVNYIKALIRSYIPQNVGGGGGVRVAPTLLGTHPNIVRFANRKFCPFEICDV